MVRTLLDIVNTVVTKEKGKENERGIVKDALKNMRLSSLGKKQKGGSRPKPNRAPTRTRMPRERTKAEVLW